MGVLISKMTTTVELVSAMYSECGQRPLNEDAVYLRSEQVDDRAVGLFIVCDGMGGHQGGEVASHLAVETIAAELEDAFTPSDGTAPSFVQLYEWVESAVATANERIWRYAHNSPYRYRSMGTTVTMALIIDDLALVANVGDSRTYALRDGRMQQLTKDHSLVAELVRTGAISEQESLDYPLRNVISRALGANRFVDVDLFDWRLQPRDRLLLCSDGLWQAFSDKQELGQYLGAGKNLASVCRRLVHEAEARDGSDNISAVVVSVVERG